MAAIMSDTVEARFILRRNHQDGTYTLDRASVTLGGTGTSGDEVGRIVPPIERDVSLGVLPAALVNYLQTTMINAMKTAHRLT